MRMPKTSPLPVDCTRCGACCFTEQPTYLPLFQVDLRRLVEHDLALIQRIGGRVHMRIEQGHCAALRADPKTARLLCSIYPRRPDVCRALARGSGECLQHHAQKRSRAKAWCDALREVLKMI